MIWQRTKTKGSKMSAEHWAIMDHVRPWGHVLCKRQTWMRRERSVEGSLHEWVRDPGRCWMNCLNGEYGTGTMKVPVCLRLIDQLKDSREVGCLLLCPPPVVLRLVRSTWVRIRICRYLWGGKSWWSHCYIILGRSLASALYVSVYPQNDHLLNPF